MNPGPGCAQLVVQKDEHKFSCAHMTVFPDGTKERMHGHNFHVAVAIEVPLEAGTPMLDFAVVKRTLAALCNELREHLLLPADAPELRVIASDDRSIDFELCGARYVMPARDVLLLPVSNVVVEQLARFLWDRVVAAIGPDLLLARASRLALTVHESPGQGASWSAPLR